MTRDEKEGNVLELERAELLIDHLPHNFVGRHLVAVAKVGRGLGVVVGRGDCGSKKKILEENVRSEVLAAHQA